MNSLLESQYNFPQSYGNGNQTHKDHSLHLSMTKPLKIPQLRGSEPLFKSEYDFIKEKKKYTMPMFLFYSASPEKQHNMPAFYSSGNSKMTLCAP